MNNYKALGVIRELFFCAATARPGGLRWAAAAVTVEIGKIGKNWLLFNGRLRPNP